MVPIPPSAPDAARQVATELQEAGHLVEILCRQLQDSVETGEKAVIALTNDLIAVDNSLADIVPEMPGHPADVFQRVTDKLGDALARLQFQDVLHQQIGSVMTALQMLGQHSAHLAELLRTGTPPKNLLSGDERLQQLHGSYVTERQRAIHASAAASDAGALNSPRVELF
ncbi:hypothetical protein [Propionivibrio sp.]|uniref:hypothetical protein n=1 Tax=Propionivibrio sp. TaxID=2212460 RepID=UPI00272EE09F|nr:hypothetical protein [Propionivibrio sp.]